jgi:hypothetical protein
MTFSIVKVYAVDSKGRVVPELPAKLFRCRAGPGRFIAVPMAIISSNDLFDGK